MTTVLVDGDIVAYRASYACENEPVEYAVEYAGELLSGVFYDCIFPDDIILGHNAFVYLTGSNNFRHSVATIKIYKGHRKPKPDHLNPIRQHFVDVWKAEVSEGEEADDVIAKKATAMEGKVVIASIDKDFLQVPAVHYNFIKKTWKTVNKSQGNRFFYMQLLTGDTADNIPGVKGIGPKKAEAIYEGCVGEPEYYRKALEAYKGDTEALLENARLLWLRREDNEMWVPPDER